MTTPEERLGSARAVRTACADAWLAELLSDAEGVALVAVGGYGRGELGAGSDLDVLMLHDGRPDIVAVADKVWYPIWDSGQKLDHSVRTVKEAVAVASADMKAVLGMLHARHVVGDADLTFTQDRATAAAIARGELSAQAAFLAGRIRVGGEPTAALGSARELTAVGDLFEAVRARTTW